MTAAIEIKERPIPFTAEMVQAILRNEKSQTRRIMKPQPDPEFQQYPIVPWKVDGEQQYTDSGLTLFIADYREGMTQSFKSQYSVGDHLWVKESYQAVYTNGEFQRRIYRASPETFEGISILGEKGIRWTVGRFMPKAAARIWLEVTDVRVERLQVISEEDAKAEGVLHNWIGKDCPPEYQDEYMNYEGDEEDFPCYSARDSYRTLWNKINGHRPGCRWEDNPMVWAYTFRRIEQ